LYFLCPDGEAGETRVGVRETGDAVVGIGIDGTAAVSNESGGGADLRDLVLVVLGARGEGSEGRGRRGVELQQISDERGRGGILQSAEGSESVTPTLDCQLVACTA
jgi:hypothetical protein